MSSPATYDVNTMNADDTLNSTQVLALILLFLVLLLVPLAVAVAAWCKGRYARAVLGLQASLAAAVVSAPATLTDAPPSTFTAVAPVLPLAIALTPAAAWKRNATLGADPAAPARRLRRRVLAVQFVAGLLYWWVLLLVVFLAMLMWWQLSGSSAEATDEISNTALNFVLWPLLVLPPLLGWAFQAGLAERRVWAGAGLFTLALAVGLVLSGSDWRYSALAAGFAGLLAAMLAAFLRPAVRGAGPPLLVAFTVGLLVFSLLCVAATAIEDDGDTTLSLLDWVLGLSALTVMFAASAWAAWRMLLRLARRYTEKRFSDLQLALGSYWALLTALVASMVLALSFEAKTGNVMEWVALAVLLLWWAWRALQRMALWWARRGAPAATGALLMLRVFKPSDRSEAFTDRFLARWRFAGPVWMIAGPDLAGAYMEPDEFFAFLGRRLHERFIASAAELPARLLALDDRRDPDSRFRVNELYCSNITWRDAAVALIDHADVVLLDLRELTNERAGTLYELEQVLRRLPLHKVVVVVDAADPVPLQTAIQDAWQRVGGNAMAMAGASRLTLLSLDTGSDVEMAGLFGAVAAAASPVAMPQASAQC